MATNKELIVWDPKRTHPYTGKMYPYFLYTSTDLKYKKNNGIDLDYLISFPQNSELSEYLSENTEDQDCMDFRLKESQKENYATLDICHMQLEDIDKNMFNEFKKRLIYLFASNNNLINLCSLRTLENLKVLDISNNRLTHLPTLPKGLEELSCRSNYLTELNIKCQLKRLDCSFNNLSELPQIDTLEILECKENEFNILPDMPNLIKLNCSDNKISTIGKYPELTELICEKNKLSMIPDMPKLEILICEKNFISSFGSLPSILKISCCHNFLTHLPFMRSLKEIYCDYDKVKKIDKRFKIDKANICKRGNMLILFFK